MWLVTKKIINCIFLLWIFEKYLPPRAIFGTVLGSFQVFFINFAVHVLLSTFDCVDTFTTENLTQTKDRILPGTFQKIFFKLYWHQFYFTSFFLKFCSTNPKSALLTLLTEKVPLADRNPTPRYVNKCLAYVRPTINGKTFFEEREEELKKSRVQTSHAFLQY